MPIDFGHFNLIKLDATPSTNTLLKEMLQKKKFQGPTVVWAKHQTQGRGQGARSWISAPNKNLTLSVYSPLEGVAATDAFLLSAGVAVTIAHLLTTFGVAAVELKWPNDILSGSKKIAGLLFENIITGTQLSGVLIGIGVNINQTEFLGLPKATSVALSTGKTIDVEGFGAQLLTQIAQLLKHPMPWPTAEWLTDYNQLLYGRYQQVTLNTPDTAFTALLKEVDATGALVIENAGKTFSYAPQKIRIQY